MIIENASPILIFWPRFGTIQLFNFLKNPYRVKMDIGLMLRSPRFISDQLVRSSSNDSYEDMHTFCNQVKKSPLFRNYQPPDGLLQSLESLQNAPQPVSFLQVLLEHGKNPCFRFYFQTSYPTTAIKQDVYHPILVLGREGAFRRIKRLSHPAGASMMSAEILLCIPNEN